MLHPGGYATLTSPEGVKESDTFTCGHCNAVRHVKPFQDPADIGGLCKSCMHLVCEKCADIPECIPFMKKVEQEEEACYRRMQSYNF